MSEILLILSALIYIICSYIYFEAYDNKDLYFIDSIFSRIPIICSMIIPLIAISYVTGLHIFQVFIINLIIFFMYAEKIVKGYLKKFASRKGLGYDYILSFIVATMFLIMGLLANEEIESKNTFVLISFITLIVVIYFNNKILSKSNLLDKYQELISSLLSIHNIEIIRNRSGVITLGYIMLDDDDDYVLVTIKEGENEIIIDYESNDKYNGVFIKEWTFFDNKNQTEIFKEINIEELIYLKRIKYQEKKSKNNYSY